MAVQRTSRRRKPSVARKVLDGGAPSFYAGHYRRGGFRYDIDQERAFLRDVLVPFCGWETGARVIEVGAGQCLHSGLLHQAGMDVTAVEVAATGVAAGREQFPDLDAQVGDAATWVTDRPGHVYGRGLSWWHYELAGVNQAGVDVAACTRRVWEDLVAPGHTLVAQMVTDLTGARPERKVHQNQIADFEGLFGSVCGVRPRIVDWAGSEIVPGRRHDRGVLVVARKPVA